VGVALAIDWPVDYGVPGPEDDDAPTCKALADMSEEGRATVEEMAVELLWRWTQKQYGLVSATIRPCRQDCSGGYNSTQVPSRWTPALVGGTWMNLGCGGACRDACGCGEYGTTLSFERAVYAVTEVRVGADVLTSDKYRVDEHRLLVRQDGGRWPYCQDMSLPAGEEGTWSVTVQVGSPVPAGGRIAAGKLACELAKAIVGDKGCALPQRVQTVTRQGVTVAMMIDQFEDLDKGKTGIWLVDSWVASVTKPDIGFSVATPDFHTGRRKTWP
jgi:hypothetical protein